MDAQNPNPPRTTKPKPTVGSLFAGIGGFDLGFEQAGFRTEWQVEINDVCREVLRDRFPHAAQFADVRTVLPELWRTDVIVGGFPCQDVSTMGKRAGLAGERTGLFFDAVRIVRHLKPRFLVLENVHGLSHQTMAATSKRCLKRLPNAGMWDTGACLTLVISESPKTAAAYLSLQALESSPHWSLWLMPDQWAMFLARAKRARKTASLRSLPDSQAGQASICRVPTSSLSPEHGIRWLSGSERLRISGFAGDWLRPTLQRLGLLETPSCRKSHGGLPTS